MNLRRIYIPARTLWLYLYHLKSVGLDVLAFLAAAVVLRRIDLKKNIAMGTYLFQNKDKFSFSTPLAHLAQCCQPWLEAAAL